MARLCWLLVLIAAFARTAIAQPPPVEELFKRPDYVQLKISPDGRYVAGIVRGQPHDRLGVLEVETRKGRPVTNFADADVLEFYWTNSRRLLLRVGDVHKAAEEARLGGWYAVNVDGSELQLLAGPRVGFRYLAPDPQGGDDIVIAKVWRQGQLEPLRLNTRSGRITLLTWDGLANVERWWPDRRGVIRLAYSYERGTERIWYRAAEGERWQKLDEAEEGRLKFRPLAFDFDNRTLYVAAREDGDKAAIHRYDFEKRRIGERLARHLDVDMGHLVFSHAKRKLLGVAYDADKPGVVWLDEDLARLQQMVDRALPDTVNVLSVADQNSKWGLVAAHSDTRPATFYLLDTEKPALQKFASSRPWIKPEAMSERKFVRYKARDGLDIPAYLTIPRQSAGKNLPLVVEIHGGPWIRKQSWGFNERAQFLASRGYAVLQPDFRGTLGYGRRHYEASFGQWGLAMQDDITDGVEWLIGQGIADKNRVCLVGGSYGGYATLWGLMKTPDHYRCGVAYIAVTDIGRMFSFNRWDMGRAEWMEYGARSRIGDPDRDREKFASVSPLLHAERLKAPVMLVYGGVDQRVPLKDGWAIRNVLDRHGKKYEWIVYDSEGHGFQDEKNLFDFYRRIEAFLKKHLD
jgi:dipeptidyl aminopeptidase/acylaminoacyl peptidase